MVVQSQLTPTVSSVGVSNKVIVPAEVPVETLAVIAPVVLLQLVVVMFRVPVDAPAQRLVNPFAMFSPTVALRPLANTIPSDTFARTV